MVKHSAAISEQDLNQVVQLFAGLADITRLRILHVLRSGELPVMAICDRLSVPQPTISHHLGILRASNLISQRRAGKQVFYRLMMETKGKDYIAAFTQHLLVTVSPRAK